MLRIYNSLTKQKEVFTPIDQSNVRMYVCGMTVYDYCHIGHGRVMVVFDVVCRYLRKIYGSNHVTYVRNITDIDDKIINRAKENKEDFNQVTARFIEAMNIDAGKLGVLPPDKEPRATLHMVDIINMIQQLVEKNHAYQAANGDVYFDVSRFENYGKLSGKQVDELRAGERVAVDEAKDDPLDFVLWKSAKPGEPSWQSPWGSGRPGWHIECSAMSTHCLGNHFDIHGGGMDLQFPHHENEIAQSEAATGERFVNVWMHNGFVRVDNEKMSKSLGNFFTIRDVLKSYDAEVVRYFILSSHYRSPLNYSNVQLDNAKASLRTLYTALRGLELTEYNEEDDYAKRFHAAMDDDFNTPEAIAVLFDLAKEINKTRGMDEQKSQYLGSLLNGLGNILGLLEQNAEEFLRGDETDLDVTRVEELIKQRNEARMKKDWAASDRIRDELKDMRIILEDGPDGTTWRRE